MKSSLSLILASAASLAQAGLYPGITNQNHTCPIHNYNGVLSCSPQANASLVDSCCVETYGGLLLSTQFWSTYTGEENVGQLLPQDTWTLHGLWPDYCSGAYTQYCDLTRQFDPFPSPNTTNGLANGTVVPPYTGPPITDIIGKTFGRYDLIDYVNNFWVGQGELNWQFVAHEYSKHATCFSTFQTECYGPTYQKSQDLIDFMDTAILYYRRLPTWGWLSAAGIRPSNTTTYSITDIQRALVRGYGSLPYIGCSGPAYNTTAAGKGSLDAGRTQISEVWYYFNSFGRPQAGAWLPTNATGSVTSCATTPGAINYFVPATNSTKRGVAALY